jgi:hypothetical protein
MNKQDAIERLCRLVTKVGTDVFHDAQAHDCFCRTNPNAVIDVNVIEFIERAVSDRIVDYDIRETRTC